MNLFMMTEGVRQLVLRILVFGLLLLLAGCSDEPSLTPLPSDAIILAYGDSLTFGTGSEEGGSYPAQLQGMIGRRVVNRGIPGEISRDGLKRFSQVLLDIQPQLVLLCHGGNDLLRRMDRNSLKHNLAQMIELAQQSGAQVVLIGVPSPGLLIEPPLLFKQLAEEYRLPYTGDLLSSLLTDTKLKSDAVHPNTAGYKKLATGIRNLLVDAGAIASN